MESTDEPEVIDFEPVGETEEDDITEENEGEEPESDEPEEEAPCPTAD